MDKQFLNQIDLSRRWGISARTLEQWRWRGEGPPSSKSDAACATASRMWSSTSSSTS